MGTTVSSGGITFNDTTVLTTNPIPSGTIMLFVQTAAPTGWTKDTTTHNDKALRVVTGTVTPGGTVAFATAFASKSVAGTVTVDNTTLTTPQIPSHTHTVTFNQLSGKTNTQPASLGANFSSGSIVKTSEAAGGGGAHNHTGSFAGTAINLAVQYVDVIIATKAAYPAV